MKILILDDDISRVQEFHTRTGLQINHVKTVTDFINAMDDTYDVIFLDHDLGDDHLYGTGADAAKWLAHNKIGTGDYLITVIIWSMNPVGVSNMVSHLKYADHIQLYKIPFGWTKARFINGNLSFGI